jgi:hypothetical protein
MWWGKGTQLPCASVSLSVKVRMLNELVCRKSLLNTLDKSKGKMCALGSSRQLRRGFTLAGQLFLRCVTSAHMSVPIFRGQKTAILHMSRGKRELKLVDILRHTVEVTVNSCHLLCPPPHGPVMQIKRKLCQGHQKQHDHLLPGPKYPF